MRLPMVALFALLACTSGNSTSADASICEAVADLAGRIGDAQAVEGPLRTISANADQVERSDLRRLAQELSNYSPSAFEASSRGSNADMIVALDVAIDLNAECGRAGL